MKITQNIRYPFIILLVVAALFSIAHKSQADGTVTHPKTNHGHSILSDQRGAVPNPVTLHLDTPITASTIPLWWSANTQPTFARYELHSSLDEGFTPSLQTLIRSFSVSTENSFLDLWLTPATTYHYKVLVYNSAGRVSVSNEVAATTVPDLPPPAVTLTLGTPVTDNAIPLTWTSSLETDFAGYELHRSAEAAFTPDASTLFESFFYPGNSGYTDTHVEPATTYHYKIVVYDYYGHSTPSNEVTAMTPAVTPPVAVTLTAAEGFTREQVMLNWTFCDCTYFKRYELYRSTVSGFTPGPSSLIAEESDQGKLEYADQNLPKIDTYYYKLVVRNEVGATSVSNQVTADLPIEPVILTAE